MENNMPSQKWLMASRTLLVLLILLSGLALIPFTSFSAEKLNWELFAGIYEPDLDVVGEDKGFPGSAFLFRGVGYPPNALATVYIDGDARGTLFTDGQGRAQFLIQTEPGDPFGRYYVTLATDANTSDTDDIRLESDEPLIPPPPGWDGLTILLFGDTLTPTATPSPTTPAPTNTPTPTPTDITPGPTDTPTATPSITPTAPPPPPVDYFGYLPIIK